MANQSKLKAWVRTDGGGTVVGSGPIFSLNKPKVGKWREMNANLCCNSTPISTTTTTTQGGGGNTPTAWIVNKYASENNACLDFPTGTAVVYTQGNTIDIGTTLWADAALSMPFSDYNTFYLKFSNNNNVYSIFYASVTVIDGIVSCTTTTTTTQGVNSDIFKQGQDNPSACASSNLIQLFWTGPIGNGTQVFTDPSLTQGYFVIGRIASTTTNSVYASSNGFVFNSGSC